MLDSLTSKQRLALINHINALVPTDFERLVFVLGVPHSVIPSSFAPQGSRVIALIEWANSPVGCGGTNFLIFLNQIAPFPNESVLMTNALFRQAVQTSPTLIQPAILTPSVFSVPQQTITLNTQFSKISSKKITQDLCYEQLKSYMQQGEWRKADEETYRLMITGVGKKYGEFFTSRELLSFPCEDLLKIDKLWRHHSNGKFGFRLQKKTYLECGASIDGEYPGDKVWQIFGDRIGWIRNGRWIEYKEVNFNISNAPIAHLPSRFASSGYIKNTRASAAFIAVSSIISRLTRCI